MHSRSPFASIRRLHGLLVLFFLLLSAAGCTEPLAYHGDTDDPYANFDRLALTVRERYCFFAAKNVDWDSVTASYRTRIRPGMSRLDLFTLMGEMLDELKDGHVNLIAPFATTYYKKWWSDYPQDFNNRTLQEYYLRFGGLQTGNMQYCVFLPDTIGYLRIPSFNTMLSPTGLDYILAFMAPTKGLIIDVRDNGGGYLTNVPEVVGRFIDRKITGGYVRHKTGPGADEFSRPFAIEYEPAGKGRIGYLGRPVAVLTNRSCFSAANDFVAVMKELDNVEIIGATTGGGGGMPFNSELPNGWGVRFSACPINDAHDRVTEFGIDPDPGCEVHCTAEELAEGKDAIIDFAYKRLSDAGKGK